MLCNMLTEAGFHDPKPWRTGAPLLTGLMTAHG